MRNAKTMIFVVGFGAVLLAAASAAYASRDDVAAHCAAYAENNGVSAEPCTCIVAAVADDEQLSAEFLTMSTAADYEHASAALKAAIAPCVPAEQSPAN